MSDHLSSEIAELKSRVDAYKVSQEAAQKALANQVTAENATIAELNVKLAAALANVKTVPADTTAAEAAIQVIIDSLPAVQSVPVVTAPAPSAAHDPNAPTGTQVSL